SFAYHPGSWVLLCESACRWTIRHPSASRRNTIVTRELRGECSVRPGTRNRIGSVWTIYAKSAPTADLISSLVRVPSENCELAQSSRDATLSQPDSTPPQAHQMPSSALPAQSALKGAGRPCANSYSAASSFAMNVAHSESASWP